MSIQSQQKRMAVAMPAQPALPARETPWPAPGEWTYEEYRDLPDDGRRFEVVKGVLFVTPAPQIIHQYIVQSLVRRLGTFAEDRQDGLVLPAPVDVRLDDETVVQPDILFIAGDKSAVDPDAQYIDGAPDLVIEVLSPSSVRLDRVVKFAAYERAGVPEYWIIDPHAKAIEVYALADGVYELAGQYAGDEVLHSPSLEAFTLPAAEVFLPTT